VGLYREGMERLTSNKKSAGRFADPKFESVTMRRSGDVRGQPLVVARPKGSGFDPARRTITAGD